MSKKKIFGIVLSSLAVVALIIVLIMSVAMPMGFWMGAERASGFDDWANSAEKGDMITVSGKIASKDSNSIAGASIYEYKFKGCDKSFTSTEDIGDEGDRILVTIERTDFGPEAYSQTNSMVGWGPNICCGVITLAIMVPGLILLLVGLKKEKKEKEARANDPSYSAAPAGDAQPRQQASQQPQPVQHIDIPMKPWEDPNLTTAEKAAVRQQYLNQQVAMQTGWGQQQGGR